MKLNANKHCSVVLIYEIGQLSYPSQPLSAPSGLLCHHLQNPLIHL